MMQRHITRGRSTIMLSTFPPLKPRSVTKNHKERVYKVHIGSKRRMKEREEERLRRRGKKRGEGVGVKRRSRDGEKGMK